MRRRRNSAPCRSGNTARPWSDSKRARRRSRCRCAGGWRPRRSRPRSRRSCPSTAHRAGGRRRSVPRAAAAARRTSGAAARDRSPPAAGHETAEREARQPGDGVGECRESRGHARPISSTRSPRRTCMHTASGGSRAGRCAESRSAMRRRSTVCTQSKSLRDRPRLVGLQCADEMTAKVPARERLEMRLRLLEIVLAEIGEARVERRFHIGRRL